MKTLKTVMISIILAWILAGCGSDNEPSYIRMSDRIVNKYLNDMYALHGLRCYGSGGGFLKRVNEIIIAFETQGPMNQYELRELLVTINEDLLQRFNENEEIRPYLKNYPFTAENLSIGIVLIDENGIPLYGKELEKEPSNTIYQFSGEIIYKVNFSKAPYSREVHKETYEEALEIVRGRIKQDGLLP